MPRVIVFNKPYGVLSQFTDEGGHPGLAHFIEQPGFYAAGRLDRDSEGCLLLTDDGKLQEYLSSPRFHKAKCYLVQLEGDIGEADLIKLRQGLELKDGLTLPAKAHRIAEPGWLWPRNPPVRERKTIPDCWIELQLTEGRNRQVRRMTAAVGFPTLRLVRLASGPFSIEGLAPGEWRWAEAPQDFFTNREAIKNQTGDGSRRRNFSNRVKRLGK